MVTYQYAAENRLEKRHHYMYTPLEGPDFLRAYFSQRANWQADNHTQTLSEPPIEKEIVQQIVDVVLESDGSRVALEGRSTLTARPREKSFVTCDLLLELWLSYGDEQTAGLTYEWLNVLIGKFEVSKRLYEAYGTDLKPTSKRFDASVNYALLASLAIVSYRDTANLKYLNVTLKLLDLLCSLPMHDCNSTTREIGQAVVTAEMKAVKQMLARQEVML